MSVAKAFADPFLIKKKKKFALQINRNLKCFFFVVLVFQPKECPLWAKIGIEDV